ncbi:S1 RNA-binding domain-containing protein [Streptomyces globisporus]
MRRARRSGPGRRPSRAAPVSQSTANGQEPSVPRVIGLTDRGSVYRCGSAPDFDRTSPVASPQPSACAGPGFGEDGFEGLVHISEPADEHLAGPGITLRAGDALPVRIVDVDLPRRRIVLTNRRVVARE